MLKKVRYFVNVEFRHASTGIIYVSVCDPGSILAGDRINLAQ